MGLLTRFGLFIHSCLAIGNGLQTGYASFRMEGLPGSKSNQGELGKCGLGQTRLEGGGLGWAEVDQGKINLSKPWLNHNPEPLEAGQGKAKSSVWLDQLNG